MNAPRLTIVSGDSHATPLPGDWPEYVEKKYHHLLPQAREDNDWNVSIFAVFTEFPPDVLEVIDTEGVWAAGGYNGAYGDLELRLAEMDREGIAAELVYPADARAIMPLYHNPRNRNQPQDVTAAGARAYHRWVHDKFGSVPDRVMLVGDPGPGVDIDAMTAELEWLADHGFKASFVPMSDPRPELPPIYDGYFDPYWSMCEDFDMPVVFHAGYGTPQGELARTVDNASAKMADGFEVLEALNLNRDSILSAHAIRPRRALWQMMLGGVFDRHPKLKVVLAEVRGDWLPSTLRHLDAAYDQAGDAIPAKRRPSEYLTSNCLCVLSFVHKAEVGLRGEIGVETVAFGRDYPHPEGMWPNTADWLSDAFAGVPEDELRLMLGENAIRFLGLDRAKLGAIAERIGPTVHDVTGRALDLDPRMVKNWGVRGGYLKPAEQVDPRAIDELLAGDLADLSRRDLVS